MFVIHFARARWGLEGSPCAIWFSVGVDLQQDQGNFAPICTLRVGIKHRNVSDAMLLIYSVMAAMSGATSATCGIRPALWSDKRRADYRSNLRRGGDILRPFLPSKGPRCLGHRGRH